MEKEFYKKLKSKTLNDIASGKITYDKLDNILRADKEIVLEAIRHESFVYYDVPEILKDDREIVLASLKKYGLMLEFVSDKLKKDREIVFTAVKQCGFALKYADKIFKEDKEIIHEAIKSDGWALQFVGRKLQKHEGIQMGGACFEMGLIEAKTPTYDEEEKMRGLRDTRLGKIFVTLSENGKEFVSYKNDLIDYLYNSRESQPSSIFSQQERKFYFKKILPEYKFENDFVGQLMKHGRIEHTQEIKTLFKEKFLKFFHSEFRDAEILLKDDAVKMYSNTIMNRLMEFGVFVKDPKSKSGPYTRMEKIDNLV